MKDLDHALSRLTEGHPRDWHLDGDHFMSELAHKDLGQKAHRGFRRMGPVGLLIGVGVILWFMPKHPSVPSQRLVTSPKRLTQIAYAGRMAESDPTIIATSHGIFGIQDGKLLAWKTRRQSHAIVSVPKGASLVSSNAIGLVLAYGSPNPTKLWLWRFGHTTLQPVGDINTKGYGALMSPVVTNGVWIAFSVKDREGRPEAYVMNLKTHWHHTFSLLLPGESWIRPDGAPSPGWLASRGTTPPPLEAVGSFGLITSNNGSWYRIGFRRGHWHKLTLPATEGNSAAIPVSATAHNLYLVLERPLSQKAPLTPQEAEGVTHAVRWVRLDPITGATTGLPLPATFDQPLDDYAMLGDSSQPALTPGDVMESLRPTGDKLFVSWERVRSHAVTADDGWIGARGHFHLLPLSFQMHVQRESYLTSPVAIMWPLSSKKIAIQYLTTKS